jgi:rod shape-determining protein MreD
MRYFGIVVLGIVLMAVNGAFCRVFHLEIVHLDVVLVLVVFIALETKTIPGLIVVAVLGLLADSFAQTPFGMYGSNHLLVWVFTRIALRMVITDTRSSKIKVLLAMSLLSSILSMIQLAIMPISSDAVIIVLKVMIPLAIMQAVLAIFVWPLARKIVGMPSEQDFIMKV